METAPLGIEPRPSWQIGDLVKAGAGMTFLAVQAAVCLVQLWGPRPARFGWQMYAGFKNPVQYLVVDRSGEERQIKINRYIAFPRGDVDDVERKVTPLICNDHPEAQTVRFKYVGRDDWDVQCDGAPEAPQPR